jgi:hypothetical protein
LKIDESGSPWVIKVECNVQIWDDVYYKVQAVKDLSEATKVGRYQSTGWI